MFRRPLNRPVLAALAILLLTMASAGAAWAQTSLTASRVESLDTSAGVGANLRVDGVITNAGTGVAVAGSYYVGFFLVADGSADITLGALSGPMVPAGSGVGPGSAMVVTSQTVPQAAIPGTSYRLAMRLIPTVASTVVVPEVRSIHTILITQSGPPPATVLPDLVAVSVGLPTTVAGGLWQWSATVQNASTVAVGVFSAGWALSANDTLEMPGTPGGDIGVSMIAVPGLAAGATTVVTTQTRIPYVPAVGRYYVFFGADPDEELLEVRRDNNFVRSEQTVFIQNLQPLTDLLAESVMVMGGTTLTPGGPIRVYGMVRNPSPTPSLPVPVQFWLSADMVLNIPSSTQPGDWPLGPGVPLPMLHEGSSMPLTTDAVIPRDTQSGRYFVLMQVDPTNALAESNEQNNLAVLPSPITIMAPQVAAPDLIAVSINPETMGQAGGFLGVPTFTVLNGGKLDAPSYAVSFYLSFDSLFNPETLTSAGDRRLGLPMAMPGLSVGQMAMSTARLPLPPELPTGNYFVFLVAEFPATVAESNKTNNFVASTFPVMITAGGTNKPDLMVESVFAPTAGGPGGRFPVRARVRNLGNMGAPSSVLTFGFTRLQFPSATGEAPFSKAFATAGVPALPPTSFFEVFSDATLPMDVPTGTYFVAAGADHPANVVSELNEFNNFGISQAPVQLGAAPPPTDPRPDLVAVAVTQLTSRPTPGGDLRLAAALVNAGLSEARGYDIGFVLEPFDPNSTTAIVPIGLMRLMGPPLASAQRFEFTTTARLPAAIVPGRYALRMDLDASQLVGEANEFNNGTRSPLPVELGNAAGTVMANLVPQPFTALPSVEQNQSCTFTVDLANTGMAAAGRSVAVIALFPELAGVSNTDGSGFDTSHALQLAEVPIDGIPALGHFLFTGQLFVPGYVAPGAYRIAVYADSRNEVPESHEGDNFVRASSVTVVNGPSGAGTVGDPPDLESVSVTGPSSATAGARIRIHCSVRNNGPGTVGNFGVGFALSATPYLPTPGTNVEASGVSGFYVLGDRYVPDVLAARESKIATFELEVPAGTPSGRYFLLMAADPAERIPELDEYNNYKLSPNMVSVFGSGAATGVEPLDLIAGNITGLPPSATLGGMVNALAQVYAEGLKGPIDVPVFFYIVGDAASAEQLIGTTRVHIEPALGGSQGSAVASLQFVVPPPFNAVVDGTGPIPSTFIYRVNFVLDPQFTYQEPKHNNRPAVPATLAVNSGGATNALSNLRAVSVGNPPAQWNPAGVLDVSGQVQNTTTIGVFQPVGVDFSLLDDRPMALGGSTVPVAQPPIPLGRSSLPSVAANATVGVRGSFPVPPYLRPGQYKLQMQIDLEQALKETIETDNQALSLGAMNVGTTQTDVTDLVAGGVAGPATVAAGGWLSVTGQVLNSGRYGATGFPVQFVLASSTVATYNDALLGASYVMGLAAGATLTVTGTFPVPPFVRPGAYYLAMIVDSGNLVQESNENNNISRAQAPMVVSEPTGGAKLSDLAALSVGARPNPVEMGGKLSVEGLIENRTTQPVPVAFAVEFFASREANLPTTLTAAAGELYVGGGFSLGRIELTGIGGSERRRVPLEMPLPPFVQSGPYFIGMVVDPDGRVAETAGDRLNNKTLSAGAIVVTTPSYLNRTPDLVARGIFGESSGVAGAPYRLKWSLEGKNIQTQTEFDVMFLLRPQQVQNLDTASAVGLLGSDGRVQSFFPIGRERVVLTASGNYSPATTTVVKLPGNLSAGSYGLAMVVDPDGRVIELDKQNNTLTGGQSVQLSAGSEADEYADSLADQSLPKGQLQISPSIPIPAEGTLQRKSATVGDRDVFEFSAVADSHYTIGTGLQGLFASALEVLDRNGRPVIRDISSGEGQASLVRFKATYNGLYYAVVSAPEPYLTGSYMLFGQSYTVEEPKAELVPGALAVEPLVATSSTKLTARMDVVNAGAKNTGAFVWELRLEEHFESRDNLLFRPVAKATVIATGTVLELAAQSSARLEPVKFGPLPQGRYDLVLRVDAGNAVDEFDESNNTRAMPFAVSQGGGAFGQADLVPAGIYVKPYRPGTSDIVEVAAAVGSKGGLAVTTFRAGLYLDRTAASAGTRIATFVVNHLAPDSVAPLRPVTLGRLPEGQHNVVLIIDEGNVVPETSETNNSLTREFFVSGQAAVGFDLAPERPSLLPQTPTTGEDVALVVQLVNRGGAGTPAVVVRLWVDPVYGSDGTVTTTASASITVAPIPAQGHTSVGPVRLAPFTTVGQHVIVVRADAADGSAESNTADNQTAMEFSVGERFAEAKTLRVKGLLLDSAGSPLGVGHRLRILNRVREAYGQAVSSADGSFATTMFPSNARRIAAAQGDRLEFQAYGPNGERYEVTDPANLVLDAATVARGLLELDVVTAPPVKTGISVKILSPDDNAHFLTDDRVPFRGLASDPYGRVIPGNNLVWRLDNAPDSFGVGESFAKRLPAGTHTVTLEARFSGTETARVTRTVTVEALAAVEVQEFTILGEVSVPDGQTSTSPRAKPQEDLTITIRNTTRNLEASGTALAGSGRYSVGFSDPTTAVAGEGDRYFVRVSTQSGEELPVSPRNLTVVKRDLAAGEHHRDLRVHFEPPVRVPLAQQGVNMISVPFRPVTTDGSEYDSEDLANDLHVSFLVRSETDANGRMTFKVYLPGLSNPFQINGNEGYISGAAGVAGHTFQGVQWEQEQLDLALTTGVNTLAYPQGVPQGTTAEDLAQQIGAKFAIRCENGRFLFYAPGLGDPFEIEVGRGLLLGSPDGTPMTLPPGQH